MMQDRFDVVLISRPSDGSKSVQNIIYNYKQVQNADRRQYYNVTVKNVFHFCFLSKKKRKKKKTNKKKDHKNQAPTDHQEHQGNSQRPGRIKSGVSSQSWRLHKGKIN